MVHTLYARRNQHRGTRGALVILLFAIISGLFAPFAPVPTAEARAQALSSTAPSSSLTQPSVSPSAASAPAATVAQQTNLSNVARNKKATQTNLNPFVNDPYPNGPPSKAVDGNTNGNATAGSVTQTWGNNHDPNDWWEVDLGGRYPITRIDVWNRTDGGAAGLHDFYVFVSDTPFVSNDLSAIQAQAGVGAYFTAGAAAATTSIAPNRSGRYVRVMLSQPGALSLAEVQVWSAQSTPDAGTEGRYNIAERKATRQTNVNERFNDPYPNGSPSNAVDGFLNGNYSANTSSRTWGNNHDPNDWWEVDLGGVYAIDSVDVWNRTDAEAELLHDFYVLVSETPFESNELNANKNQPFVSAYFVQGPAERTTNVAVNRTGRYVRIILTEPGILSLTEVQVWSKQAKALDAAANTPTVLAWPDDGAVYLYWLPVPGAVSYRVQRATSPGGSYTTIATNVTTQVAVGGSSMLEFIDPNVTNGTPYYYIVQAIGPLGGVRGTSSEVEAYPSGPESYTVFQPVQAANYYAQSSVSVANDTAAGHPVVGSVDTGDYLVFNGMDFGTSATANGVVITYAAAQAAGATVNFYTSPSEDSLIASVPVTSTGGLSQWSTAAGFVKPVQGVQTLFVRFQGKGDNLLRLDTIEFLKRGPYDTDTVKWDPNIVLLQKAMGITLDTFVFNTSDNTMLMTFKASATAGRQALAKVKVGSIIASDTNLDLGGPYARVLELVSMSTSQIAVKTEYVPFNQLIIAGGIDLTEAINQSFNDAAASLNGTSALSDAYDPNGYDTIIPNVVYEGDSGGQASRTAGMASLGAATSDTPTVSVPSIAKGAPTGHFHVTLDNIQFIHDEDGFGLELVNLKMNGLGVQPINSSNPVASQFGFGVLGGVGADKLRAQVRLAFPNAILTRDKNVDIGAKISVKAHFQLKGLAVALWFFDVPAKFIKPIRFPVPTPVGPVPSSLVFGLQGYIIGVGTGNLTAEFGVQGSLQPTSDLSKVIQVGSFGDTKFDIGQRVENVSVLGFTLEPYAKVRFGAFDILVDNALSDQVLRWIAFGLRIPYNEEQLKKIQGLIVLTFTPRLQFFNILKNWKDKDTPIFEQKLCAQPVVKAEALPGFPKKMTFEIRIEIPVYLCLLHTGWLYYDMQVEDTYQANPQTGEADINWSVPIISERSNIPHKISWYGPVPYELEQNPEVESRNIADAFPGLDAAGRRKCVIYRRPFVYRGQLYPVKIEYDGPCNEEAITKVKLLEGFSSLPYTLRVMTEYRMDNGLGSTLANQIDCDINLIAPCGTFGVWSEKNFVVNSSIDDTEFKVNSTQVYTDSAARLDAIEGKECDPDAKKAIGMELSAAIAPVPAEWWRVQSGKLYVDGVEIAATMSNGTVAGEKVFRATQPQDLAAGAHTLKIVAVLEQPDVVFPGLPSGKTRTATYYATFKAKPKDCGRAKSDEFGAVIYEGSRCSKQETPFSPLDVLSNDDLSGNGTWQITSVSGASLGQVKISDDKQQLLYKPSTPGVDTLVYELTFTASPAGPNSSKAAVLVNNRIASSDADCAGGGGGGGGGGGAGGSGTASGWGDPHLTTADGKKFDSHAFGEFIYFRPQAGKTGITVHGRQEIYQAGKFPAITTALAFQIGSRRIEIRSNKTPAVLVDGASVSATAIDLGGSASLTIGDELYQIRSSSLSIDVRKNGTYLDYSLTVPRNNTLEGMLGSPNGDVSDDWKLPNGTTAADMLALADAWRITDAANSLFTYPAGESPSTYNKANTFLGQMPTDEQLAPYRDQARSLLTTTCDASAVPADETTIEALALELYIGTSAAKVADQLCGYEVSGTITSTNPAGAPVPALRITMTSPDTRACVTITNREGRYRCRLAPRPNAASAPTVTVKVPGSDNQTVVFPAKAAVHTTISQTLDLAVTLPTVLLNLTTRDADYQISPGITVQVSSGDQVQEVTTGADGKAQVLFSYKPGTTTATIGAIAVAPAYSDPVNTTVIPNTSGTANTSLTVKHLTLGTPAWVRETTGNQTSDGLLPMLARTSPAIGADGTIYTLGYQYTIDKPYRLVATNPNGTPKWVSEGFNLIRNSSPSIGPDGTIYVLTQEYPSTKLHAFAPNGTRKWTFTTPEDYSYSSSRVAVGADGLVYFVSAKYNTPTATFYGINQATGTVGWSYELSEAFTSDTPGTPVFGADGTLYFVGSRVWGFYPDGTVKQSSFSTYFDSKVAIGPDGTLYLTVGYDWNKHNARTQAVNPDLSLRWSQTEGSEYAPVVAPDGSVYLAGYYGMSKLNGSTGAILWQLFDHFQSTPVISTEGTVYASVYLSDPSWPGNNQLIAIAPDGTVQSRFTTRGAYNQIALTMGRNGLIYMSVDNPAPYRENDLYAIPTGSSGLAAGWSSAYGDRQNTNRAP